jgi:hypothetical protein
MDDDDDFETRSKNLSGTVRPDKNPDGDKLDPPANAADGIFLR